MLGTQTYLRTIYKKVIFKKTAILFDAAAKIGAIIAKSETSHIQSLSDYGRNIGMAFQLNGRCFGLQW
jgi:geranylgeranyl pyrophosphate synthase